MRENISGNKETVSIVILTLNAENSIAELLNALRSQTVRPHEIIVADSESTDKTVRICSEFDGVEVLSVLRREFNHGGTRDMVFRRVKGDFVLFMTHDAIPADQYMVERMLAVLTQNPQAAAVYGRQLPRLDATCAECLIRSHNYPAESHVYSSADIQKHNIKTFFFSNVCAMYRRETYFEIGGFEKQVMTNEDMFFAAAAIRKGWHIAYAADAAVIHSHNFSLKEQYRRNYMQGYEIERHRELLAGAAQEAEGIKLVKVVSKEMLSKGRVLSWIGFGLDCCVRFAGSRMGRRRARKYTKSGLQRNKTE